jgi:hypothetical protein
MENDIFNEILNKVSNTTEKTLASLCEEDKTLLGQLQRDTVMNIEQYIRNRTQDISSIPKSELAEVTHVLTQLHSLAASYQ